MTFGRDVGVLRRYGTALAALTAVVLVAGCGSKKPDPACPKGVIPQDAAQITRFRDGPGRDLTDVVAQGEIQNILVQCKYDKNVADIDLQIAVVAARGPADRSGVADFDYFVAIVDPDQKILTKQPFKVHFEFADNRTQLGTIEQIEPKLPLADVMKAPDYQLIIGFQLTQDELDWNRRQRAKAE